jgi:hypothetical protein
MRIAADCAAVRRELDRIAEQIVENLFQPIFVAEHITRFG